MSSAPTPPAPTSGADDKLDRGVLAIASVVVLGAIMSILDVTVVNVAINTLAKEFDSPLSTIQWVVTGYTLALATVIPLTGWAADRFGTKRLYLTSIFLFVCGSMLSGLAWSAESLIGFRILQGFGGGMIMPLGMTILTRAAGPQRVGRVMAIIGVPMLLGPILGPILGGWLVDAASWRWIFFINLPIGIAALIASQRILARDVPQPGHRLDVIGLALLSPGLALLIYGLAETSGDGGFGRSQVIGPGLVGPRDAGRLRVPRPAHVRRADRPAAVRQPRLLRLLGHADPRDHLRLRRHAAAAALPAGGPRRDRDGHRPAARPAGPRRDDRDADRGPPDRQDRRRAHRPVRARRPSRVSFLGPHPARGRHVLLAVRRAALPDGYRHGLRR